MACASRPSAVGVLLPALAGEPSADLPSIDRLAADDRALGALRRVDASFRDAARLRSEFGFHLLCCRLAFNHFYWTWLRRQDVR